MSHHRSQRQKYTYFILVYVCCMFSLEFYRRCSPTKQLKTHWNRISWPKSASAQWEPSEKNAYEKDRKWKKNTTKYEFSARASEDSGTMAHYMPHHFKRIYRKRDIYGEYEKSLFFFFLIFFRKNWFFSVFTIQSVKIHLYALLKILFHLKYVFFLFSILHMIRLNLVSVWSGAAVAVATIAADEFFPS